MYDSHINKKYVFTVYSSYIMNLTHICHMYIIWAIACICTRLTRILAAATHALGRRCVRRRGWWRRVVVVAVVQLILTHFEQLANLFPTSPPSVGVYGCRIRLAKTLIRLFTIVFSFVMAAREMMSCEILIFPFHIRDFGNNGGVTGWPALQYVGVAGHIFVVKVGA